MNFFPDFLCHLHHTVFGAGSEWFWTMIQSLAIIISLIFIYRQVRIQRDSNMLQMLSKMRESWDGPQMIKYRHTACENRLKSSRKIDAAESQVLGFFEEMGLFLRKGVLEEEFVWITYSYFIEHYWSMLEPNIKEFRLSSKDKSWFEEMETLRLSMRKYGWQKNIPTQDKTDAEVKGFHRRRTSFLSIALSLVLWSLVIRPEVEFRLVVHSVLKLPHVRFSFELGVLHRPPSFPRLRIEKESVRSHVGVENNLIASVP